MNDNEKKIIAEAIQIVGDAGIALATAGTASAALVKDLPVAKDILERLLLEAPALDAPSLDPVDRANADAASAAAEDAKFPKG